MIRRCATILLAVSAAAVALPLSARDDAEGNAALAALPRFVTAAEIQAKDRWVKQALLGKPSDPAPFSFVYGDQPSVALLKEWPKKTETEKLDDVRTRHTFTWTDPKAGLEVRCVAVDYADFPTIEWTLYFKNTGKADTPILKDIQALNTQVALPSDKAILHYNRGTIVQDPDFEPLAAPLVAGARLTLTPNGGRPCGGVWPYFNLQCGNVGRIVVVGWPGKWSASFGLQPGQGVRASAGQELVHAKLHPGEQIRSPLMVQQFYQGDWQRAQNAWRRWMLAHTLPRRDGKLPPPQLNACSSHQFAEMTKADEKCQKLFVDRFVEEGVKLDYWWMDAGWYPCDGQWWNTGTWEVDKARFPNGLRAISDHARAKGIKTIVWFEPERCQPNTWLPNNHKEWLMGGVLLNLGDPDALNWAIKHFGDLVETQGVDLYRQDYNIDPLPHWRGNDAPDRQGITENAYVVGYLAYWDALRKRFPNMLIDSCASGGHRNDLETMRRSLPLLRSDRIFVADSQQGQSYGLSYWLPFTGTGELALDVYRVRSCMAAGHTVCWDMRDKSLNYDLIRKLANEWRAVAHCYLGDYYPLTPYSLDRTTWMAWQFDCPEQGEGLVQAFRRDQSAEESMQFKLQGLEPDALYTVKDFDVAGSMEMTGRDLCEKGLSITTKERPSAVVITYKLRP
jgi:alpha-galactosidase